MQRPVIGIIGNHHLINDQYPTHAGGTMNSEAIAEVADCVMPSAWAARVTCERSATATKTRS